MKIKQIVKQFENGNVSVFGLRGRGKDLLIGNVVARRKKEYISNVDYGGKRHNLDFEKLDCGKNTYQNFIKGDIKYYEFPYKDGTDIYISDVGVYLPSQYCNELNRQFSHFPTFMALSRHLGNCNVHFNVQNLNRAWDKLREQSDLYIEARGGIVLFGFVIQKIRTYEKYESACNRTPPMMKFPCFPFSEMWKMQKLAEAHYISTHGIIKTHLLFYKNKAKYDTRMFKQLLKNGKGVDK